MRPKFNWKKKYRKYKKYKWEIFKRTGSLTKLQKSMGHSSVNVSLTYLRGLEVAELNEDDMPMIY